MNGTERAALRYALGVLRDSCGKSWSDDWPLRDVAVALYSVPSTGLGALCRALDVATYHNNIPFRLLRARMALYLRALLRQERGRWWVCEVIDESGKVMNGYTGYAYISVQNVRIQRRELSRRFETYEEACADARYLIALQLVDDDNEGRPVVRLAQPLWLSAPPHEE